MKYDRIKHMVIVTGATGHIGNVLVRELLSQGEKVRVLVLPNEDLTPLNGLDVEIIEGNVLDPVSLVKAFTGVDVVYHLAGIIEIQWGKRDLIHQVNVQGTKNVIDACLKTKVKRLVYTSSIHALEPPENGTTITEDTKFVDKKFFGVYDQTKSLASQAILKAVKEQNLDAVLVAPTGVIGPYDYRISQMGRLVLDFFSGALKAYLEGGYNYVDVRDVAKGLVSAAKNGRKGELYLLSGEFIQVSDILKILEQETGKKAPRFKFPKWLALAVTPLSYLWYKILKRQPLFTAYSIKVLGSNANVSHAKATKELNYQPRPIKESIIDHIKWLQQQK